MSQLIRTVLTCAWLVAGGLGSAAADVLVNKAGAPRVLDAKGNEVKKDGCFVQLNAPRGGKNQDWDLEDVGDGYVKIVNRASGKLLTPNTDLLNKDGCNVMLWQAEAGSDKLKGRHQHWKLQKAGGDYYHIVNRANGKVLDANAPDVGKNGCPIQLWVLTKGTPEQLWKVSK